MSDCFAWLSGKYANCAIAFSASRVVLEGHASGEGSAAHNKRLSELRARRIQRWLEEEGVQKNRILGTSGYGATRPRVQEPPSQEQWRYSP
ncbi:MAG TPA: OmpA family protein [Candidatus Kapabacteria bacterium]|nr:OmpA family protein [Candidatus Kapabacteria bacterium]